jgi:hypothetical protein
VSGQPTAPVTDEREHDATIRPLLADALGTEDNGDARIYAYGEVPGMDGNPGTVPAIYALLVIERRYVPPGLMVARANRSGWRVTVRGVGRTVNEARWAITKATRTLEDRRLQIAGATSTPLILEVAQLVEPDDGRFSGLATWTYAL